MWSIKIGLKFPKQGKRRCQHWGTHFQQRLESRKHAGMSNQNHNVEVSFWGPCHWTEWWLQLLRLVQQGWAGISHISQHRSKSAVWILHDLHWNTVWMLAHTSLMPSMSSHLLLFVVIAGQRAARYSDSVLTVVQTALTLCYWEAPLLY